jgi:hypothetical protein
MLYLIDDNLNNLNQNELNNIINLYNTCYQAMHKINSQILISNDASLYKTFLDNLANTGGKLDFILFHKYDCDGTSMSENIAFMNTETRFFTTDSIRYGVNDVRKILNTDLIAICSESNFAATWKNGTDPRIQQVVGTVWLALLLRNEVLQNVQFNAYYSFSSSESDELTKPRNSNEGFGFGMINDDNYQPYYTYLLYQLIGTSLSVGDRIISSDVTSNNLRVLAWEHNNKLYALIISKSNSPTAVTLSGFPATIMYSLIDDNSQYTNAQIQTGVVTSNEIIINGYAVILLQST